jgi:acyl-CoA synthetase (AMP-forming)/AMP-acid ligase II/acyl carrier protein
MPLLAQSHGPGVRTEDSTLVCLLQRRALERPDLVAFRFLTDEVGGEDSVTYGELDRRARAVAARLQRGGHAGSRAVLVFQPGLDFVAALFGCFYAGVVAIPVDPPRPRRPAQRIHSVMADARAPVVIAATETELSGLRSSLDASDASFVVTSPLPGGLEDEWEDPHVDADALAVLQYTSGSTAAPRGVMLTHANVLHNVAALGRWMGVSDEPRGVFWLPHFHDMGLIGSILLQIHARGSTTLFPPASFLRSPIRWLQEISRVRGTHTAAPNFAFELCVRRSTPDQRRSLDLRSLVVAFNGGEAVRAETLDRFAETFEPYGFLREAMYPSYGLAEVTLLAACDPPAGMHRRATVRSGDLERGLVVASSGDARDGRALVGCGPAPAGHALLVVDPATMTPAPVDRVGEIWISGPSVASGYWGREAETAETFGARLADSGAGPFLRTGDLGFVLEGDVYVAGRLKDVIIVRGRNIYPQDVEAAVGACDPELRTGCGAAFSVEAEGEEGVVVLHEVERHVRRTEADAIAQRIRSVVTEEFEVMPAAVLLLRPGGVPRTPSGKVRRLACREAFLKGELSPVAEWRPSEGSSDDTHDAPDAPAPPRPRTREEIEAWLVERLVSRVGVPADDIDPQLPFAYYGIDSVEGVAMARALSSMLGRDLPETLMWDYPTLESLCRHLGERA